MRKKATLSILMAFLLSSVTAFFPPPVRAAEGIRILSDLEYVDSSSDTKNKQTAEELKSDSSRFVQLYDIEIQKELSPYLAFRAGGLFESNDQDTKTNGLRSEFEETTTDYFAALDLDTPLYKVALSYRNDEVETDVRNLVVPTISREQYIARLSWRPEGFPALDVNYDRSDIDDDPETRDSVFEALTIQSHYDYDNLSTDYTYTRQDFDEKLLDSRSLTQIHTGRIDYSTSWAARGLSLTAGSRLNHRTVEFSGTGDIELPTSQGSEFFLLDDSTPDMNDPDEFVAVDAANPLTTVDIGPDGPQNPVSVGLEFPSSTEVDKVHVMILEDPRDPTLASPSEINSVQGLFLWQIFSSDDQENWTPHVVTTAIHDVIENRFEISFSPTAEERYLKAVTQPLSGGATRKILIADLEAVSTLPGGGDLTIKDYDLDTNLGLRWAISDRTTARYDTYYEILDGSPFAPRRKRLSNSVSLRHVLSPIFVGTTRFLRLVKTGPEDWDEVHNQYVASLRANYLDTFSQTLTYSGSHTREDEGISTRNSIFLRNAADLYTDWNLNLDCGYSWQSLPETGRSTGTFLRVSTNLIPNRRMNLRLDYSLSFNDEKDGPDTRDQTASFQGFLLPFDTLSLFASVSVKDRDSDARDEDVQVSQDYSVNWAPFPDGSVSFSLRYTDSRERDGTDVRMISPEIVWEIARGMLLTLTYDVGTRESDTEEVDLDTFRANVRVFF